MKYFVIIYLICCQLLIPCYAKKSTNRIPQFENQKVEVWQTVIYPNKNRILQSHRHDQDHVIVALTPGKLKITNNKGQTHFFILKKGQAYFLPKDPPGDFHGDENVGKKPIKVIVVSLRWQD